jgi:hypothetical protein
VHGAPQENPEPPIDPVNVTACGGLLLSVAVSPSEADPRHQPAFPASAQLTAPLAVSPSELGGM